MTGSGAVAPQASEGLAEGAVVDNFEFHDAEPFQPVDNSAGS
jgi:hypothetical protein